jgi:hypothetical protein
MWYQNSLISISVDFWTLISRRYKRDADDAQLIISVDLRVDADDRLYVDANDKLSRP